MIDVKIDKQPESGSFACYIPVLRFSINFDLDLPSLLDIFKRNPTCSRPVSVRCYVEKLSK